MTGKTNSENLQAAPGNTKNQLNGFCHDVAGNLAFNSPCPTPPWSFTTYVYDAENRLITAAGATYIYDGDGNRVEKLIGTSGTIYWRETDGELTNETDTTNVTLHRHVYFAGRRVCRTDTAGGPGFLISPAAPTRWVPRSSRTLRRAGIGNACANESVTPRDPETRSSASLRSLVPARLHPKDRNDNCSNPIPQARPPIPASPDCDAYTSISPRASSSSTR
jgi:hypothetical protein